jgi:alkylation response protein AidB-like acyl-CoA dehydrogenase
MDLTISPEAERLRDLFREFFATRLPREISDKVRNGQKVPKEEHQLWHRTLNERGWLGTSWKKEYGGTGWGPLERFLFDEAASLAFAPRANIPAIDLLGPVLIEFGTEDQKRTHLPRILTSDDWWCQGFSEPQAGSDLAALQMRAVRDGDDYVVTGTKLWTSWAHHANKIFCLVRTSTDGPKQAGISFLLIDMEQPGITVSPIITLGGMHAVNEVQIEEVRVPATNLVGDEGGAWTITKFLLGHERLVGAWIGPNLAMLGQLKERLKGPGFDGTPIGSDPALRLKVAEVESDLEALRYTAYRVLADELSGREPGPVVSVLKVRGSEIQQALTDLLVQVGGLEALVHPWTLPDDKPLIPSEQAHMAQQFFDRRKLTIYGGSAEIQRNIIARQIVGV